MDVTPDACHHAGRDERRGSADSNSCSSTTANTASPLLDMKTVRSDYRKLFHHQSGRSRSSASSINDDCESDLEERGKKVFVSMEIFADRAGEQI